MSASSAKYLLCAEAVTAAGFNLDVSVAVGESDLDMYDTATLADQDARITVAPVTYLESDAAGAERALALLTLLVEQLTARLPGTVSSVPLYVRMPEVVTQRLLDEWLQTMHAQESSHKTISRVKLSHDAAHAHFTQVLNVLAEEEILLAVSIDAPIAHLEALAADNQLQTNQHPWG
ncbi:hypothetical protein KDD30_21945 (plasmid) [Photobacterium sp. GJ3]|uniref:hypothetical protein n=1 Tax=Photobacterium sp. GJ3 TaxID=2829502 RepID=UPI001B8D9808|nr:hypothetical protein [Photobacterium sp. GJ3]QUJ69425.1 hypothetical protein KDD30_21945 [Photobacterium sp. GJ3]